MILLTLCIIALSFHQIQHCQIEEKGKCVQCQQHHYLRDNLCQECPIYCISCKIENQQVKCESCSDPLHMTPICTCLDLKQYVGKSGICAECPISCHQCTGDDLGTPMCGTCSDRLNMVNKYDHCECKNPALYINPQGLCTACSPVCTRCHGTESGGEWCDECIHMDAMKIVNGVCKCKVESDYIGNDLNCLACDSRCNGCFGGSNKECYSCNYTMRYVIMKDDMCVCDEMHKFKEGECYLVYSWKMILVLCLVGVLAIGIVMISIFTIWC